MANYKKVAEQILSTVGGAENVASVTHCMTRLRFNLKDESLSNDEKLEDISSIISVVHAGGQVQLVVGPTVDKVYDEVCKQGGFEVTVSIDEELDGPQLSWKERLAPKHLFNQLLDAVSGAITPILPIFCVAGIFKMLVILFGPEGAGFMSETSDLYRILSLVGDAAYYYFPVFAAYSSAKKFKTSPVLALLIAVVMIYPDMLVIVEDGKPFSVFGIPMQLVNYTKAVLPVILITWAQSYVERFFKKISPDMLRILIVPVGTVLVMLPVALCLCGPCGRFHHLARLCCRSRCDRGYRRILESDHRHRHARADLYRHIARRAPERLRRHLIPRHRGCSLHHACHRARLWPAR